MIPYAINNRHYLKCTKCGYRVVLDSVVRRDYILGKEIEYHVWTSKVIEKKETKKNKELLRTLREEAKEIMEEILARQLT